MSTELQVQKGIISILEDAKNIDAGTAGMYVHVGLDIAIQLIRNEMKTEEESSPE